MKIALICPTRARPQRFDALHSSVWETARYPLRVELHALRDPDDQAEYPRHLENVSYYSAPARMPVPAAFEYCAALALARLPDVLMLCSDDCLFRTRDWDVHVEECVKQYPDRLVCIAPEDLCGNGKANFWFVTREWIEAVGWFTWTRDCGGLGAFEHFCADTVVEKVARKVKRFVALPEVVTEHMHAKYGKAENDALYREKRIRGTDGRTPSDRDIERMAALEPELEAAAARVQRAITAHAQAARCFDPVN